MTPPIAGPLTVDRSTDRSADRSTDRSADRRVRGGGVTLRDVGAVYWRFGSPRIITVAFAAAIAWRLALGGFGRGDLVVIGVMIAAQPFVEWIVHVTVLHWRPRRVLGRTFDPLLSRKHRAHHADPRDLLLVFIPLRVLVVLIPVEFAVWWLVMPTRELAATAMVGITTIGVVYEWVHFLVHTDYKPRHWPYRAMWRNHRLHHFRNENYWFAITSTISDIALRTNPDRDAVPTSPTATDLFGERQREGRGAELVS